MLMDSLNSHGQIRSGRYTAACLLALAVAGGATADDTLGTPAFSLSLNPAASDACIPRFGTADTEVGVEVSAEDGYTGTVALSASGEPDGVTGTLDPDTVTPPGAAVWTLSVASTATAGETPVLLTGDDGERNLTAEFLFNLETELSAPVPAAPADGAFGVVPQPVFFWESLPNASGYRLQVATDTIFIANLVMDETVPDTQMTATLELEPGTEYYWRVRGDWNCGGAWSDVFGFTTLYNTGDLIVSPGALDFGEVHVDAVSTRAFTIEHVGDADLDPLQLTAIESEGDAAFAVIGGDCSAGDVLAPGESCAVETGFSPDAEGGFTGGVRVAAADGQEVTTVVTGTGLESEPLEPAEALFRDRFEPGAPSPTIITGALPDVHVLERYEIALAAEGGTPPYTWAVGGLPGGLFLDAVAGTIANNPVRPAISGAGEYNVTFEVTDAEGLTAATTLPLSVVGIARISAGEEHSCAVSTAGRGYCWGHNDLGQLGNGSVDEFGQPDPLPSPVADPDDPSEPMTGLVEIAASRYHSCAVTEDNTAYCWGWNAAGRLGNGTEEDSALPVAVADPDDPDQPLAGVTGVSVGQIHSCASTADGRAYCWGDNFYGQIGTASPGNYLLPTPVVDPENTGQALAGLAQVDAGNFHTCAVTADHAAYCWGWNTAGQLGNNTSLPGQFPTPLPQQVVDPEDPEQPFVGFARISGGNVHTCALSIDDTAYCWGLGNYGQLGDGNAPDNSPVPAPVAEPENSGQPLSGVGGVNAGGLHSCGAGEDGRAYCWGSNDHGQLGDGGDEGQPFPVPVVAPNGAFPGFDHVSARGAHACAVSGRGIPYCWGDNRRGQLGDGGLVPRAMPVPVSAGETNQ